MHTNPVLSSPAAQNEAAVKAAPRQNAAPQASVPQDKVTLSPQAQARSQPAASADKNHDGDSK
jgi:hypothetical protein